MDILILKEGLTVARGRVEAPRPPRREPRRAEAPRLRGPQHRAGAHAQLRKRAAQHMLANPANFQPFCTADDFSVYCREVEATAQWGSQMELQALCHSLRTEIWVHAADSEVIKMGTEYAEEGSARALQVTYHLHYYAMGEHYNSVATGSM